MSKVKRWRRLRMGLQTLFGLRRQGFFIPYRYADSVAPIQPVYAALAERFAAAEPVFLDLLRGAEDYGDALLAIAKEGGAAPSPKFDQGWFPTLDAVAAYTLVRQYGPRRIVEVGSGHSTRFLARAVKDAGLPTEITAIDPQPRAAIQGLPVRFHQAIMQTADASLFAELQPGDILFIDSSHILMPGTDVDWLFNRVLPQLPHGVLIHIHDIFLPDDYPQDWAWRGYNEQQAIGPLLTGGFQPVFSSHYALTRLVRAVSDSIVGRLPHVAEARPASLWLVKPN
ncbi:MAG: class I SAM-dependent methyltransferase [Ferrovibrio sp.]|uniref:class I SAM-dependent methyltransferase n=1 Tax=Ferrovibrio sp. TaxID=1917215 RepID=UPI002638412D|nr:class I SAM-dependent methyltransferase [Ferrovibrio sp.]MCW0234691.1 class I SAM-dependent methyltransferase [Ferrovibrio sp.]